MARTGNNSRIPILGTYGGAPTFAADLTEISSDVADLIDASVATFSALPVSGNWYGRQMRVQADNAEYVWLGTSWVRGNPVAAAVLSRNTTTLNVATGTATQLTDTYMDTTKAVGVATSGGAITITASGDYWVSAGVMFVANGTGIRQLQVNKNSVTSTTNLLLAATTPGSAAASTSTSARRLLTLATGDVLRMFVAQNSGGLLAVGSVAADLPGTYFEVVWAGA